MSVGIRFKPRVKQRDIVLVPFPFTDQSQVEKRPALVISSNRFNKRTADVICCAITSSPHLDCVEIASEDLESGSLDYVSWVKPSAIFTLYQYKILKRLGRLSTSKSKAVVERIILNIRISDGAPLSEARSA